MNFLCSVFISVKALNEDESSSEMENSEGNPVDVNSLEK